jgi:alpha-L-fucosidase
MRTLALCFLLLIASATRAQPYTPDWQSLDKRPVPQWFRDAKFGIFIHWGVYAVPGWSSKGQYAEWYQQGLQTNDSARQKFHRDKFGDRSYYDLARDFKAERYDPDEWAKLFERSGAKYIVLTSKHHDGYTLWPNKQADQSWGFPWSAKAIGPQRDLLGDLFKAVRKTSVHAGMYYSLYEWFNPLWKNDRTRFINEHTWPQMKELINTYQPDIFWTDGDWDATAEDWKSQQFIAWLYNESPVKDKIVINDRWGSGVRFHHGGIYTPEYQPDLDFEDHYWEESRGMGYSYGYNREEDAWDYNSTQSLVLQLIDKVSRGGNFLLDIGPDEHGKIPPIMQERLLQIGDWLKINGEAIYGTTRWKYDCQWSDGKRGYKDKSGDMLLKITVDPDPGYAVKEVFYTYKPETRSLYAILPVYPSSKKILLHNIELNKNNSITLLANGKKIEWEQQGEDVLIKMPDYDPNTMKAPYAYVLKIANYGRFIPKPGINVNYPKGALKPVITLTTQEGAEIYYTLNGADPESLSNVVKYEKPFTIEKTSELKFVAVNGSLVDNADDVLLSSKVVQQKIIVYEWRNAVKPATTQPGIAYKYYQPTGKIDMNFTSGQPQSTGIATTIGLEKKQRADKFAFEFNGFIKIDKESIYEFFLASDDGSRLFIDDVEVIDNDGDHGTVEKAGKIALRKGFHRIRIQYFDSGGGNELSVSMQPEDGKKQLIPAAILYH